MSNKKSKYTVEQLEEWSNTDMNELTNEQINAAFKYSVIKMEKDDELEEYMKKTFPHVSYHFIDCVLCENLSIEEAITAKEVVEKRLAKEKRAFKKAGIKMTISNVNQPEPKPVDEEVMKHDLKTGKDLKNLIAYLTKKHPKTMKDIID